MAFIRNKVLFAKAFIFFLISHAFIENWSMSPGSFVHGEYTSGMNPGMILRLEEKSIDASKRAM